MVTLIKKGGDVTQKFALTNFKTFVTKLKILKIVSLSLWFGHLFSGTETSGAESGLEKVVTRRGKSGVQDLENVVTQIRAPGSLAVLAVWFSLPQPVTEVYVGLDFLEQKWEDAVTELQAKSPTARCPWRESLTAGPKKSALRGPEGERRVF